jgi:glycosyltransferase involved in cell wall biosynthesis
LTGRILFVTHGPADPRTAVYANFVHRANHLRMLGYHVDLVTPSDLGFRHMAGIWPFFVGPAALFRARPFTYDLVLFHSHAGWASLFVRPLLDRARRAKFGITLHGLEPLYHEAVEAELRRRGGAGYGFGFRLLHRYLLHWLLRASCRRADLILCLSSAERRYLVNERWSTPHRVVVVANGVDDHLPAPPVHRGRALRLLWFAQWLPAKGTRYVIDAFARLAADDPELRLVCAGTGRPAEAVLADFPDWLRPRVEVVPSLSREEVSDQLRRADIFVFPSLYEAFGNVIAESMAAGLPIVSTPTGAGADLLRHEINALVVPFADGGALAAAIRRLVFDPELRERLGTAAWRDAEALKWDRLNAEYAGMIAALLQHGPASGETRIPLLP